MLRKQLSKTPEETRKTTERENTDDLKVQDESQLRRTLGRGSGRVFSGFGIGPKYVAGIGKTINILTGSGI